MTSMQRNQSFGLLVAYLFLGGLMTSCSEKSNQATPPKTTSSTGSDTDTDTDTDTATDSGEGEGGDDGAAAFDLCTALLGKKDDIDGFSSYIDELCGSGEGQNKLPTLRKAENVYDGGEPKLLKKSDNGDGKTVSVRLFTSTIVDAKATDYFALVRLQVSKPDKFSENYDHDELIKLSDVDANDTSSSFTYDYSDGEGRVAYEATARFYTLKKSTAFVSATSMDKSIETMEDFKGMIIVNDKGGGKAEVFTMSDQKYEVANDQDPKLYDTRATEKAGLEQKRMYKNADKADKAPGLLK